MAHLQNSANKNLFRKLTYTAASIDNLATAAAKLSHELKDRIGSWAARSFLFTEILRNAKDTNYLDKKTLDRANRKCDFKCELEKDPQLAKIYFERNHEQNNRINK